MSERYREVMRRKDAPHVYFPATPQLRKRLDVLELAYLDTETNNVLDALPSEKAAPKPKTPRKKRYTPSVPDEPKTADDGLSDIDFEGL